METYIYTLSDTTGIRYIGKADVPSERLKKHLRECSRQRTKKEKWLFSLRQKNELPVLEILDTVDGSDWARAEMYWIAQCNSWGMRLLNGTDGGEGSNGFKGKKHTEESKQKIGKSIQQVPGRAGVDNNNASLTAEQVADMRYDYDILKIGTRKLTVKYGIPRSTIERVVKRITYQ